MRERSLAERYARALLEVAEAQGVDERIEQELAGLAPIVGRGTSLIRFLESPQIARAEKFNVLRATVGRRHAALLLNLLCLLVEKGRVRELPMMIEEYGRLFHLSRGVQSAVVTAARPLTKEEHQSLRARLEALTGRPVTLEVKVDKGLLGGLMVRTDHRVVDGSLSRRLRELALALKPHGLWQAA